MPDDHRALTDRADDLRSVRRRESLEIRAIVVSLRSALNDLRSASISADDRTATRATWCDRALAMLLDVEVRWRAAQRATDGADTVVDDLSIPLATARADVRRMRDGGEE